MCFLVMLSVSCKKSKKEETTSCSDYVTTSTTDSTRDTDKETSEPDNTETDSDTSSKDTIETSEEMTSTEAATDDTTIEEDTTYEHLPDFSIDEGDELDITVEIDTNQSAGGF